MLKEDMQQGRWWDYGKMSEKSGLLETTLGNSVKRTALVSGQGERAGRDKQTHKHTSTCTQLMPKKSQCV